jgi:hypothetical protein
VDGDYDQDLAAGVGGEKGEGRRGGLWLALLRWAEMGGFCPIELAETLITGRVCSRPRANPAIVQRLCPGRNAPFASTGINPPLPPPGRE